MQPYNCLITLITPRANTPLHIIFKPVGKVLAQCLLRRSNQRTLLLFTQSLMKLFIHLLPLFRVEVFALAICESDASAIQAILLAAVNCTFTVSTFCHKTTPSIAS